MRFQVQRPFQLRHWCNSNTSVFQTENVRAALTWRTSLLPSWCHQLALDPVSVAEPVQIRPREPVSIIMHKAKRPATGSQVQVTRCESEVHVHFFKTDTRESVNPLGLEPRGTRGSTEVSDHFIPHHSYFLLYLRPVAQQQSIRL